LFLNKIYATTIKKSENSSFEAIENPIKREERRENFMSFVFSNFIKNNNESRKEDREYTKE